MDGNLPPRDHNAPPDPIDLALEPFGDAISEAENWLDGTPVQSEEAMQAVDVLIRSLRTAKATLAKEEKSATAPLHDAWKAEKARWKPTVEDVERRLKGLVSLVDGFKRELAARKEQERAEAARAAREAEEKAKAAAQAAEPGNYEQEVAADAAIREAKAAQEAAQAAKKDTVKGLREKRLWAIDDYQAAVNWIAANDKPALAAFIDEYVRRNHVTVNIAGTRSWTERVAY
ncbi:MAG: hypothetical protein AAGK66_07355 [Pseudomonadota bacterium]